MVANLLCHKRITAKRFTAQPASSTMSVAFAPTKGQTPVNLVAGPAGPQLREGAVARSDSRGLRGGTSFGRYIWISSDLLEQLNGALAMTGP